MDMELITIPETAEMDRQASNAESFAAQLEIVTHDDYVAAGAQWKALGALAKEIKETFEPIRKKLEGAKKEVIKQRDRHLLPVDEAKKAIKAKMISYDAEQERLRKAEQERLQLEAKKKAEDEAIRAAEAAEAAGKADVAEAIIEAPPKPPAVTLPKGTPAIEGFRTQTRWDFEITDEKLIPRQYLVVDHVGIRKVVMAMKDDTNIPGIRAFSKTV